MGQAATDLPDPLKNDALDPQASVDDLLSQMAGDEIDRLLAEADTENSAVIAVTASPGVDIHPEESNPLIEQAAAVAEQELASSPVAAVVKPSPQDDPEIARQIDALFDELNSTEPSLPAATSAVDPALAASSSAVTAPFAHRVAPPPPPLQTGAELDRQLDDLFQQLTGDSPAGPVPSPAAPPSPTPQPAPIAMPAVVAPPASVAPAAAPQPVAPPIDITEQTGAREKQILADEIIEKAGEMLVEQTGQMEQAPDAAVDETPPLWLRILTWINAPLSGCSDQFRATLGRVAIVTFFNATAMLLYVMLFRR